MCGLRGRGWITVLITVCTLLGISNVMLWQRCSYLDSERKVLIQASIKNSEAVAKVARGLAEVANR